MALDTVMHDQLERFISGDIKDATRLSDVFSVTEYPAQLRGTKPGGTEASKIWAKHNQERTLLSSIEFAPIATPLTSNTGATTSTGAVTSSTSQPTYAVPASGSIPAATHVVTSISGGFLNVNNLGTSTNDQVKTADQNNQRVIKRSSSQSNVRQAKKKASAAISKMI